MGYFFSYYYLHFFNGVTIPRREQFPFRVSFWLQQTEGVTHSTSVWAERAGMPGQAASQGDVQSDVSLGFWLLLSDVMCKYPVD